MEALKELVNEFEKKTVEHALWVHGGRITLTAKYLGITRKNLWQKIKKYEIVSRRTGKGTK